MLRKRGFTPRALNYHQRKFRNAFHVLVMQTRQPQHLSLKGAKYSMKGASFIGSTFTHAKYSANISVPHFSSEQLGTHYFVEKKK